MKVADPYTLKKGDRVRLMYMPNDPDPVPVGTLGTVQWVTDLHGFRDKETQVIMKWDNGRSLCCICPPDVLEIVRPAEEK